MVQFDGMNKRIIESLKSPIFVGICLTFLTVAVTWNYYNIKGLLEAERLSVGSFRHSLFQMVEWMDLKNMDGRLLLRGEENPSSQVGLLTIDDRSIEEIGRWPWSREKIAHVIDEMAKYGVKAIGFDIVFSEPQVDPSLETIQRIETKAGQVPSSIQQILNEEKKRGHPDLVLAQSLANHKDKLVLGVFNEESNESRLSPYQDYCRNEAFQRSNAEKFVKLNVSFIVNDEADPFVDLPFGDLFGAIFADMEEQTTKQALKEVYNKNSVEDLNEFEKRQLKYLKETRNMEYCQVWLTENDPYWNQGTQEIYTQIFAQSKDLKGFPLDRQIAYFKGMVKPLPIAQHQRWTINTDQMQDAVDFTGSFNAEQDADGTIRRASLFFRTGNRIGTSFIPSLALQTYLLATGYRANIEINLDPKHPEQKTIRSFKIVDPSQDPEVEIMNVPVDEQGRALINYAGGRNMYPYLPAKELFNGKDTATIIQADFIPELGVWHPVEKTVKKDEFIKGKSFIFGATAIGVYDLRVTPFEKNYPGPETHVTALGNLFQNNFLKTHPNEEIYMLWAVLIFGCLLSFAISETTAIPGFLITLGSIVGIGVIDQWLLSKGFIATMVLPGLLVVTLYIFLFFYKYLTEERKKKHLRSTFSKYVSPAIVDEILKDPENVQLGGKKQRMTVFFSDVRGFTTISEKLDPQALSDLLTRYLTPMTQIVFSNKGTLDKYMGDAMMAFFGAPIFFPDHAKYGCRAALQNLEKLKELQKEFSELGLPHIDIGIGLNSAEMSVGNMGSDIVRNYTVMGDAVNLGSRLEGITKEYGVRIVLSQFTYSDVKDEFTCRELDRVKVKGKNEPVKIYELVSEGTPSDQKTANMLSHFNQGYGLYSERNFKEALEAFKLALAQLPGDGPSELYVERCEEYIANPPSADWDGVFTMKTK